MDCAENEFVAQTVYYWNWTTFATFENSELSMTNWPGHVWLQKKVLWNTNKVTLEGLLPTFMHRFGWWDFVYFITKP